VLGAHDRDNITALKIRSSFTLKRAEEEKDQLFPVGPIRLIIGLESSVN